MDLDLLRTLVGRQVVLRFADGHAVRARLVSVNSDEPPEITYDVNEVIAIGPSEFASVKPGIVAAADPRLLRDARIVDAVTNLET